ncbi:telomerase reverse transcriptase [Wolffia australiana]
MTMKMMKKKKNRVPEVLRKVYGDGARTLGDTLLFLSSLPQSNQGKCPCGSRECIRCGGKSFLIRQEDGDNYRQLIDRCFCVVSPGAPELTDFCYRGEWTQKQIVRYAMESVRGSNSMENVLSLGNDESNCLNSNGEFLCSLSWSFLLTRIGESAMTFLLKHSSIFLPLSTSNYHQVTGPLLNKALPTFDRSCEQYICVSKSEVIQPQEHSLDSGCKSNKTQMTMQGCQDIFAPSDLPILSVKPLSKDFKACLKTQKYLGQNLKSYGENGYEMVMEERISRSSSDTNTKDRVSVSFNQNECFRCISFHSHPLHIGDMPEAVAQGFCNNGCESISVPSADQTMEGKSDYSILAHVGSRIFSDASTKATPELFSKGRKRKRLYSWQRHRIFKQKSSLNNSSEYCSSVQDDKEMSRGDLHGVSEFRCENMEEATTNSYLLSHESNKTKQYPTKLMEPNLLDDKVTNCHAVLHVHNVNHLNEKIASTCFYCFVLRHIPKISERAEVRKRGMFYNTGLSSHIFLGNHILSRLKPNNSGASALLEQVFGLPHEALKSYHAYRVHKKVHSSCASGCLYQSLLRILKTLIRNSRKCQNRDLLRRHCSVLNYFTNSQIAGEISKAFAKKTVIDETNIVKKFIELDGTSENPHLEVSYSRGEHQKSACSVSSRAKFYSEQKEVVSFIWAAVRSIVPVDLLGDHANWRSLRKNIAKLVRLRRFETVTLSQCVDHLQASKFSFLSKTPDDYHYHCQGSKEDWRVLRDKLFRSWIYWFFSHLVVPLLAANFYVTEIECGKHEAFYFPKPVWSDMQGRTLTWLKEQNYKPVDMKFFSEVARSRPFGFSRVRFVPKERGMRLVANLGAPSKARLYSKGRKNFLFRSVNSALHDVHAVLKKIKLDLPQMLGASVFDYNDVYEVLYEFLAKLKNGSSSTPNLFIVVADVSKAFDSINQDRLLDVMKDVIKSEEYLLRRYAQVVCTKKATRTRYSSVCISQNEEQEIENALTSIRSSSSHGILTDQGVLRRVNRSEIHHLLHEHVKLNILRLGQELCLQKSGISQGGLISSLLCSFYYGHLERSVILPFLEKIPSFPKPQYTLLRLVDDFLFISTSKEQAGAFFSRLRRGFREYNCYMNSEKFGLNFDFSGQSKLKSNRRYVGEDGVPFLPWSGLLINCLSLEIQADYTRYMGIEVRSTLTVHAHSDVEERLGEKLCNYMRPKCHPLFYDSNVNSPATVRLNLYQAFLLCAMKFHAYLRHLPSGSILPSSAFNIVLRSISYMHRLIKKRVYGARKRKGEMRPWLRLKKKETLWLGLRAYVRVLKKKQSRHGELLQLLNRELDRLGRLDRAGPSHLAYAVDDSHSTPFWHIKY